MKKVLFIQPPLKIREDFIDYPFLINIGMYNAATILREKYFHADIIDCVYSSLHLVVSGKNIEVGRNLLDFIEDSQDYDLIIIAGSMPYKGCILDSSVELYIKIMKSMKPGVKIALADFYIGSSYYKIYNPLDILKGIPGLDFVLVGECEFSVLDLIDSLDKGKDISSVKGIAYKIDNQSTFNPSSITIGKLDSIPLLDTSLIRKEKYLARVNQLISEELIHEVKKQKNIFPVFSSRGCIYDCIFCSRNPYVKKGWRSHSIKNITDLLRRLNTDLGIDHILFMDDSMNLDKKRFREIINLLKQIGLTFSIVNGVRSDLLDKETISLLKNNGLDQLFISAECGDQKYLDENLQKGLELTSVVSVAQACKEVSLPLQVHYIIGFPEEEISNINSTLSFALDLYDRFDAYPRIQYAEPREGTKLYDLCIKKGVLNSVNSSATSQVRCSKIVNENIQQKDLFLMKESVYECILTKKTKMILPLTYKCNNNCDFCCISFLRGKERNPKGVIRELAYAKSIGIDHIDIDGGEPTISEYLFKIIRHARSLKFKTITIVTNGRMLAYKSFVKRICDIPPDNIIISVHGPPEIHNAEVRVPKAYQEIAKGIRNLRNMKGSINISINLVITKSSIKGVKEVLEDMKTYGIEHFSLIFVSPTDEVRRKRLIPSYESVSEEFERLSKYSGNVTIHNLPVCLCKRVFPGSGFESDKSDRIICIDGKIMDLQKFFDSGKKKTSVCNNCVYFTRCQGLWPEYLGFHDRFTPQKSFSN